MKIKFKKIILLLITLLFLYFVFINLDFKELLETIKGFKIQYLFLLSVSVILSLACRGICFKQLISKTLQPPLYDLIPLCITGAALNIVLPARAGDIFRAYYVGQKYCVDKIKIFGTIMLERIFDGLIILLILLFAIFLYNRNQLALNLSVGAGFIFVGCLILSIIAVKYNKTDEICRFLENKTVFLPQRLRTLFLSMLNFINKTCNSFVSGFEILCYPGKLVAVIAASVGIWFFECLNYFIMIQGFNCDVPWTVVLFIISFIALACMIPSASIFIGPYQFAVIAAFAIYDIPKETALAVSLVEQAAVTILTSIIAAIFLITKNIRYQDIKEDMTVKQ